MSASNGEYFIDPSGSTTLLADTAPPIAVQPLIIRRLLPATVTSHPVRGAESDEKPPKRPYFRWDAFDENVLLEWLEENYERWRSAAVMAGRPHRKTMHGQTKTGMAREFRQHLLAKGSAHHRPVNNIREKIGNLEKSYRQAEDLLRNTGDPKTTRTEKLNSLVLKTSILKKCRHFVRLEKLMGRRSYNQAARGEALAMPDVGSTAAQILPQDSVGGKAAGAAAITKVTRDEKGLTKNVRNPRENRSAFADDELKGVDKGDGTEKEESDSEEAEDEQELEMDPQTAHWILQLLAQKEQFYQKKMAMQKEFWDKQLALRREELRVRTLEAENQRIIAESQRAEIEKYRNFLQHKMMALVSNNMALSDQSPK
ncbi:uncharacterized protein LOC129591011 [Paramacrobiotus metropolitanus]|uniref:uncharacterized protein LOC129591011 n=1 Tax=Paramacrobiotus metropolitanus TaxID=2943436 RepID=UPI002445DCB2|nr:uncharacterized protein LOC129591011 [Paramacrobiotus metropolitanus]